MTSNNIQTALDILTDEVRGDVASALSKMDPGYTMTWMYRGSDGVLFPHSVPDFSSEMKDTYAIMGRKYEIINIVADENRVFVELIESYPDEKAGGMFRTPLVIVLEFKDGKILRGRHYCDPRLSHEHLTEKRVQEALKGSAVRQVIE